MVITGDFYGIIIIYMLKKSTFREKWEKWRLKSENMDFRDEEWGLKEETWKNSIN